MSCEECIDTKLSYSNKKPDCVTCGFIKPISENIEVLEILDMYGNFMYDGMSGMPNFIFIIEILKREELSDRKDLLTKIMLFTAIACTERNKPRHDRVIKSKNVSKK